jgi:hypothetical protein
MEENKLSGKGHYFHGQTNLLLCTKYTKVGNTFLCSYEKAVNTIPIEASRKERNRVVVAIVIVECKEGQEDPPSRNVHVVMKFTWTNVNLIRENPFRPFAVYQEGPSY